VTIALAYPALSIEAGVSPVVRANGLGKVIDERVILDAIDFELPRGGFAALLGANGAGKSTLLKILATLVPPSSGELALFGEPLRRPSPRMRSRIGLIGHGLMLYRDLTARENLVFYGRLNGVAEPRSRAEELLEFVGLPDRGDDPVRTLSRGMAQRVSIARALVHDPDLLLADEPFAGLDAPSQDRLETLLQTLRQRGHTILLANHDLEQSLAVAERVIVLRAGRLVLDARAADIDRPTLLAEVTGP
jgi:heme exporter protein A